MLIVGLHGRHGLRPHAARRGSLRRFSRMALAAWIGPTQVSREEGLATPLHQAGLQTKTPRPNNVRFAHQKPQTRRQGRPINSTIKQQEDQERHRDQCKANPRHRTNLAAPRDPPRYPFLCLCALCGFAHQKPQRPNPRHPANLTAPRDRYPFLCLCALCGFAHHKPQRPRQSHPINSTIAEHRDQDRQIDLGKASPRHPIKLTVPRDPPRYAFVCLCALSGSCIVGCVLWVVWVCVGFVGSVFVVSDCRAAREAWLATPRNTTRFTSTVFPHGLGCLDWPGPTQHDALHFDGFPAWLWLLGLAPRIKTTSPHLGVCGFCVGLVGLHGRHGLRLHATRRGSLRRCSRMALAAWIGPTPRNTTRFTSMVFPHGFGCLDWPHA